MDETDILNDLTNLFKSESVYCYKVINANSLGTLKNAHLTEMLGEKICGIFGKEFTLAESRNKEYLKIWTETKIQKLENTLKSGVDFNNPIFKDIEIVNFRPFFEGPRKSEGLKKETDHTGISEYSGNEAMLLSICSYIEVLKRYGFPQGFFDKREVKVSGKYKFCPEIRKIRNYIPPLRVLMFPDCASLNKVRNILSEFFDNKSSDVLYFDETDIPLGNSALLYKWYLEDSDLLIDYVSHVNKLNRFYGEGVKLFEKPGYQWEVFALIYSRDSGGEFQDPLVYISDLTYNGYESATLGGIRRKYTDLSGVYSIRFTIIEKAAQLFTIEYARKKRIISHEGCHRPIYTPVLGNLCIFYQLIKSLKRWGTADLFGKYKQIADLIEILLEQYFSRSPEFIVECFFDEIFETMFVKK